MTATSRVAFKLHRWLAWGVGLQVVLWVVGGLVFSLLPFHPWVKGGDVLKKPQPVLAAGWHDRVAPALAAAGEVSGMAVVATPAGTALKLTRRGQPLPLMVAADGSAWQVPDAASIGQFAAGLYKGEGRLIDATPVPPGGVMRLGIVDETSGRQGLWRVRFDDTLSTRYYFDAHSGELVALRNEAWVWYDFFWRLHIMDYGGGENFNHWLIRVVAVLTGLLVAAGAVLSVLALRRRWRRRHV